MKPVIAVGCFLAAVIGAMIEVPPAAAASDDNLVANSSIEVGYEWLGGEWECFTKPRR